MQCEYVTKYGQCERTATKGLFCDKHCRKSDDELKLGQYLISKRLFGDAPTRHMTADEVKSLRVEIAMLRTMIERRWNMIDNDVEFANSFSTMKDSFMALEKLITSCHTLEVKLDNLMSKSALLSLAQKVVSVINQHLPEDMPDRAPLVEKIGEDIFEAIKNQENI